MLTRGTSLKAWDAEVIKYPAEQVQHDKKASCVPPQKCPFTLLSWKGASVGTEG